MLTRSQLPVLLVPLAFALVPLSAGAAEAPAVPPGVKADVLMWIQDAEDKLGELAAAMPQAKYSWRPAKDVRSVGDVFMHVVTANYRVPSFVGTKPPEGMDLKTLEKSLTKKADIEQALKDSFAHVKKSLIATPDADLDKPTELFGMKTTVRGAYLMLLSHAHEHLGQSIAYARSNNIAPPWTERRNAKASAMKKDVKAN
jgi:uncharacterized damage-inducible protein DinB